MYPPVEDLLDKVDSKFTLVALAARRGRQINSYYNGLGSEGIGTIVPPQVASTSRKSLSIALEEIAAGKIQYIEPAAVEAAALAAAEAVEAAAAEATAAEMPEPEA
jgi:DNA-directed RNA polymerase subunit omega